MLAVTGNAVHAFQHQIEAVLATGKAQKIEPVLLHPAKGKRTRMGVLFYAIDGYFRAGDMRVRGLAGAVQFGAVVSGAVDDFFLFRDGLLLERQQIIQELQAHDMGAAPVCGVLRD